jgi:environmental stress-induced protein Ves
VKLVEVAALPRTPWRNGAGTTTAIAAEPEAASFDDCAWRVDLSDIGRAGPFSDLPGLDRTIVPLAPGLVLTVDCVRYDLDPFEPFAFSGDHITTCEIATPTQAFNALTRRGRARATVARWDGPGRISGPGALICYVVCGGFSVVVGGGRAERVEAGAAIVTRTLDQPVDMDATGPHSLAVSAVIRPA